MRVMRNVRAGLADKEAYQQVGEATEVALRMLAEKIGLQGFARMPAALSQLSRQDRATFCNDYWTQEYHKARISPSM
jgi:P-type Ca2+ transporter type 2A